MVWVFLAGCSFSVGAAPGIEHDAPAADDAPHTPDGARPDAGPSELVVRIASSADDALQDPDGSMLVSYSWMSLYSGNHWGALRFALAGVAQGATIHDAYLEVVVDSTEEDSPDLVLATQSSSMPPQLIQERQDISSRPLGSARVTWNDQDIGDGLRRSPPLAALVQERVDDPTWAPGAHVLFVLDGQQSSSFELRQFDHQPQGAHAAKLYVTFTNP